MAYADPMFKLGMQQTVDLLTVNKSDFDSKKQSRDTLNILLFDYLAKGNTVTELPSSKRKSHARTFRR